MQPASSLRIGIAANLREWPLAATGVTNSNHEHTRSPTDREVLGARIIDRSLRPFFPKGYAHDTQLITTVTSYGSATPVDTLSVNAASAALCMSDIPFFGPVAAVRVGWVDGELIVNPSEQELSLSQLSLLYAGTACRTAMIEMDASEIPEHALFEALQLAHGALEPYLDAQRRLAAAAGKPKRDTQPALLPAHMMAIVHDAVYDAARRIYNTHTLAKQERGKAVAALTDQAMTALAAAPELAEDGAPSAAKVSSAVNMVCRAAFRDILLESSSLVGDHQPIFASGASSGTASQQPAHDDAAAGGSGADAAGGPVSHAAWPSHLQAAVLNEGVRVDGRNGNVMRPLSAHVDIFPRVHGSSLFTRGETQCMGTVTLGPPTIAQQLRPVAGGPTKKSFMLHYDFPPYSINEVGRVGGNNRRMVGHGALAEKAIAPLLPEADDFPYVIRATSEVSGSDGSSSMATVCAVSLALMDAGVPLAEHVAGASVGLITPPDLARPDPDQMCADDERWAPKGSTALPLADPRYLLLTDIKGLEDHHGDMDFKVAGTSRGVTAIQLDVKLPGVPLEILAQGIKRARAAHTHVLETMNAAQDKPRESLKPTAPRMGLIEVPRDERGRIIGPGGVVMRGIQDATGAALRFLPDADVLQVFAEDEVGVEMASEMVHAILAEERPGKGGGGGMSSPLVSGVRLDVGEVVQATVSRVLDFGVVLAVGDSDDAGLLHVSQFVPRMQNWTSAMPVGKALRVVVTDVDALGRAKFSMRLPAGASSAAEEDANTPTEPVPEVAAEASSELAQAQAKPSASARAEPAPVVQGRDAPHSAEAAVAAGETAGEVAAAPKKQQEVRVEKQGAPKQPSQAQRSGVSPTHVSSPFPEAAPSPDSFKNSASLQLQSLAELQDEQVFARDYSYLNSETLPSGGYGGGGSRGGGSAQQRRGRSSSNQRGAGGQHSKRGGGGVRGNKQKRSK